MGLVKGNPYYIVTRNGGVLQAANWIRLICSHLTATANHGSQFRKVGGSAAYAVPASTTLKCKSMYIAATGTASVAEAVFGYADNAPPAYSGGAYTPTNPVYFGSGDTTKVALQGLAAVTVTGNNQTTLDLRGFDIPTGKYPFFAVTTTGGGSFQIDLLADEVAS